MVFLWALLLVLVPSHSAAENPEVIFAQPGGSVTIPRRKWESTDKFYVNWFFVSDPDKELPLIGRNPQQGTNKIDNWKDRVSLSSDFSLIISPVLNSDFNLFRCKQYELTKDDVKEYKLYRVNMPTTLALLTGETLSISFDLDYRVSRLVKTSVTCYKPDGTQRVLHNMMGLTEHSISSKHSGVWSCLLKTNVQLLNATTAVTVIDLAPSPDPVYTSISSKLSIPCFLSSKIPWSVVNATGVSGGNWNFSPLDQPKSSKHLLTLQVKPSPFWKHLNGTRSSFMEKEVKDHDLSVQISQVNVEDRGTYTCSLKFRTKELSRMVKVEVLQVVSSALSSTLQGNTVNLSCTLGHAMTPDLEVKWTPPRYSSLDLSGPPPHPVNLTISEVSVYDSGWWKCDLRRNNTVLTSATVHLIIVKAPVNIWLVVSIVSGILMFILLSVITVIIVRRRRQAIMYKQRKTRFCCCKNPQPKGFYRT
ncbi:CD4-1 molecule [Trichomycterus rosablanca]|uniref:CD4-1 molecule n=1 Tax=Trichomycterus rosablanca TaxID=2290929 RepID=UPI002F3549F5